MKRLSMIAAGLLALGLTAARAETAGKSNTTVEVVPPTGRVAGVTSGAVLVDVARHGQMEPIGRRLLMAVAAGALHAGVR